MRESIFFRNIYNTESHFQRLWSQRGFTMIEVLVVAIILAILILLSMISMPIFIARANDGRRKSDLEAFKIAFERYYDDYKCYPDPSVMSTCRATVLATYIPFIMCDPKIKTPYEYIRESCKTFKIYTVLEDTGDPDIKKIGCDTGCGPDKNGDGVNDYNYGVSSGDVNVGSPVNSVLPGLCILGNGKKCYAGVCSACCPGDAYRCDMQGVNCVPDTLCTK